MNPDLPSEAPGAGAFLTAAWHHLAMVTWDIDPHVLQPRVPQGTELDTWQGRTFVSLVGFRFLDTRVRRVAVPFHRHFEEVNLRFYVRRRAADGWRRGVVFVREIVPRRAIASIARWCYNEPYVALPMRHRIEMHDRSGLVEYGWRFRAARNGSRAWQHLRVHTTGAAQLAAPDSEESFITEHYWGYTAQRDGGTLEYRVEHPPWKVWQGVKSDVDVRVEVEALYGAEFVPALATRPASAVVADGSPVTVYTGERLPEGA
jgi:uncharacterized protein